MKKQKKLGLVLGGGGARGFCHLGILEIFAEHNIKPDIITGCSMGALAGGLAAAGVSVETMREMAKQVGNSTVFDLDIFSINQKGGIAKGNRAMRLYRKHVGEKRIEDCNIKFACIATDIQNGRLATFTSGCLWESVRASMAIPGLFQPVRTDNAVYVDGGVLKRMPISEARDLGANIIIAVDAIGPPYQMQNFDSIVKVVETSFLHMDWRGACKEGEEADILIVPDMGTKSLASFKNNEEAIEAGRKAAVEALPTILKLLKKHKIV